MKPVPLDDFPGYLASEDGEIYSTLVNICRKRGGDHPHHMVGWVDPDGYRHGCTREEAAKAAQQVKTAAPARTGSGKIAGLTWRHQLARDLLAQHERDRIAATIVKPVLRPGRRRAHVARDKGRFV